MIIISMMIMISPEFRIGADTDNLLQTVLKGKADTLLDIATPPSSCWG